MLLVGSLRILIVMRWVWAGFKRCSVLHPQSEDATVRVSFFSLMSRFSFPFLFGLAVRKKSLQGRFIFVFSEKVVVFAGVVQGRVR